jgi:hypothetical protein
MKIVLCIQQPGGGFVSGTHADCIVRAYTTVALGEAMARLLAAKHRRTVRCQVYAEHDVYCDNPTPHTSYSHPDGRTLPHE